MTASAIGVSSTLPVHPLVAQLFTRHGCTEVTADNIDTFVAGAGHAMLVFTEDPLRVRETLDIAVIVPQLMQAEAGRTTERRSGTRAATTFRKLPSASAGQKANRPRATSTLALSAGGRPGLRLSR